MTSTAAAKADVAASTAANMMSIPLSVLRIHGARDVDFYIWQEGDEEPTLYCSADVALTNADLDRLGERGHKFLYVTRKAYAEVNDQLNAVLREILADDSIAAENRLGVLQTALALEVDAAFQTINADRFVSLSQQMAGQINELLCDREVVPRKLFEILRHDFYTFTHVTNVASFATLLAEELGYSDRPERERITVGALLHDIGKKFVPNTLLCKKGKLSDAEWRVIKSHPQRGYEELCDREDLDRGQLLMAYSHHERIDGKGYPVGLCGEEIHDWAKLLAIVDVFEALTGSRPYRSPMKCSEALELLERNAGTQFDAEMAKCWISLMRQR
jgi:HD-GYP domain-containing protein (c-di-GMP phosphodiesterase class II)